MINSLSNYKPSFNFSIVAEKVKNFGPMIYRSIVPITYSLLSAGTLIGVITTFVALIFNDPAFKICGILFTLSNGFGAYKIKLMTNELIVEIHTEEFSGQIRDLQKQLHEKKQYNEKLKLAKIKLQNTCHSYRTNSETSQRTNASLTNKLKDLTSKLHITVSKIEITSTQIEYLKNTLLKFIEEGSKILKISQTEEENINKLVVSLQKIEKDISLDSEKLLESNRIINDLCQTSNVISQQLKIQISLLEKKSEEVEEEVSIIEHEIATRIQINNRMDLLIQKITTNLSKQQTLTERYKKIKSDFDDEINYLQKQREFLTNNTKKL